MATGGESSYGHCRCCLTEGSHRDIIKVYNYLGEKEVYSDIFLDCFNVFLSSNTNLSTLICNSCVDSLRSARDFKKMVLHTEERLMNALQNCEDDQMVLVNVPVSKETMDSTIGFKIQMQETWHRPEGPEPETPQSVPGDNTPTVCSDNEVDSDDGDNDWLLKKKVNEKRLEKWSIIYNATTLIENCNATLFKTKMKAGFPCFYCREIYENFQTLREHQLGHGKDTLANVMSLLSADAIVIYAEVTNLECTLCESPMPSLKDLKTHLKSVHNKRFYKNVSDRVVPYKLCNNYYECQLCSSYFETFGAIERHMNIHYRNYVCEICDHGFVSMTRLKTHMNLVHREGHYPCEFCNKAFTTQSRRKVHEDFVHRMLKKLKCQKCDARFSDYFVQKKHMVDVHGEAPIVYRCNVCGKSFNRRYTLSCHMKRHLEQKDFKCEQCKYTCYSRTELREHMLRHNKKLVGVFRCDVCDKSYSRKKTLREHLRVHEGDARHVCGVCGEDFATLSSLKSHSRSQHNFSE